MTPSARFRATVVADRQRAVWHLNSLSDSWKYFAVTNSPGPIAVFTVRIIRSACVVGLSTSMTGARCVARAGGRLHNRSRENSRANISRATSGDLEPA